MKQAIVIPQTSTKFPEVQWMLHLFKRLLADTSDKLVSIYLMPKEKLFSD